MIGLGIGRLIAALFGQRNRKDAYRSGYEYVERALDNNRDKPQYRRVIRLLINEANALDKQDNMSAKARASGMLTALEDHKLTYTKRE